MTAPGGSCSVAMYSHIPGTAPVFSQPHTTAPATEPVTSVQVCITPGCQCQFNKRWQLLNELRLKQELCDVTLVSSNGHEFRAHSVVLASSSSMFHDTIQQLRNKSMVPGPHRLNIEGLTSDILEVVLDFIYGVSPATSEGMYKLKIGSDSLGLHTSFRPSSPSEEALDHTQDTLRKVKKKKKKDGQSDDEGEPSFEFHDPSRQGPSKNSPNVAFTSLSDTRAGGNASMSSHAASSFTQLSETREAANAITQPAAFTTLAEVRSGQAGMHYVTLEQPGVGGTINQTATYPLQACREPLSTGLSTQVWPHLQPTPQATAAASGVPTGEYQQILHSLEMIVGEEHVTHALKKEPKPAGNKPTIKRSRSKQGSEAAKRRISKPELWKRNIMKSKRLLGQEYINKKGELVKAKTRSGPCCTDCRMNCSRRISEDECDEIFGKFWSLGSKSKMDVYLYELMQRHDPYKRRNAPPAKDRPRLSSFTYYVKKKDCPVPVQICQSAFLNIHGISQTRLRRLQVHKADPEAAGTGPPPDMRGRHHNKPNKLSEDLKDRVREHIRLYLASHQGVEWKGPAGQTVNIKHMWLDYLKKVEPRNYELVHLGLKYPGNLHERIYREIFNTEFKPHLEALKGCMVLGRPPTNDVHG